MFKHVQGKICCTSRRHELDFMFSKLIVILEKWKFLQPMAYENGATEHMDNFKNV